MKVDTRDLDKLSSGLESGASRGLDEISQLLETDMRLFAPIRTGALKASIETDKYDSLTTVVGSDIYYAHYVDKYYERRGESYVDRTMDMNSEDLMEEIILDEIIKNL